MMRNIISIDPAAWTIVKDGFNVVDLTAPTKDKKKKSRFSTLKSGCLS